jgi:diguanylate cyclase (GGDEF)-like protein/PAS domain S-box-containing protein
MNGTLLAIAGIFLGLFFAFGFVLGRRTGAVAVPAPLVDKAFDSIPIPLFCLSSDRLITRVSQAFGSLLGTAEDAPVLGEILHPEDRSAFEVTLQQLAQGYGHSACCELRLRHCSGHLLWVEMDIVLQPGAAGYLVAAIDITERKRSELWHRSQEEQLTAIVERLPVAVRMLSPSDDLMFVNTATEQLFGRSKEQIYADPRCFEQLIHPDDVEHALRVMKRGKNEGNYELTYRVLRDDGDIRYIREQGTGLFDERGQRLYQLCSATDISDEMIVREELHDLNSRLREANLRLEESVRLDSLTGCLSRAALLDEADKALQLAQRYQRSSALVFFDLNNFKAVNDNFGHHIGDRCLVAFAEQIKTRLRVTDELGRYGGDEFVALLRETDAEQARKLISTLAPIVLDDGRGSSIILRFSAGVACSDIADIQTVDEWLRIADVQMYRQKLAGVPRGS